MIRHFSLVTALLLFFTILSFFSNMSSAQTSSSKKGFSIELGAGYNQLFWESTDVTGTSEANRVNFSIMPTLRLTYQLPIRPNYSLLPFTGYNEFGGHDDLHNISPDPTAEFLYKDQFRFQNVEVGIVGFRHMSNIQIGIGAKVNRHINITQRYYWVDEIDNPSGWHTDENPPFFKYWSVDAGLKVGYETTLGINVGAEGWFGLSNLAKEKYQNDVRMKIRQNHFRVLVGYRY